MKEPEIKTVTELKIFLNGKIDKLDDHLKKMESNLTTRLEKTDSDIRGEWEGWHQRSAGSLGEFNESIGKIK